MPNLIILGEAITKSEVRALQRFRVSPSEIQSGCQRQEDPQENCEDQESAPWVQRRVFRQVSELHQPPPTLVRPGDCQWGGGDPEVVSSYYHIPRTSSSPLRQLEEIQCSVSSSPTPRASSPHRSVAFPAHVLIPTGNKVWVMTNIWL